MVAGCAQGSGGLGEIMGAVKGGLVWLECFTEFLGSQGQQWARRDHA